MDNFNKGHTKGSRFPFSENLFSKLWKFVLRLAKGKMQNTGQKLQMQIPTLEFGSSKFKWLKFIYFKR